MTIETLRGKKKNRFSRERNEGYKPEQGSFERVLIVARNFFEIDGDTFDESFWVSIKEKAAEITDKQAVFQHYLAGVGHLSLASRVINSMPQAVASAEISMEGRERRQQMIDSLSDHLLNYYPPSYRQRFGTSS